VGGKEGSREEWREGGRVAQRVAQREELTAASVARVRQAAWRAVSTVQGEREVRRAACLVRG
jgi:hypothetical protein